MSLSALFLRQFWALFRKNWIILSKHPFLNILRCFILPVAYGVFLAVAQLFLTKPNNLGIGGPVPVSELTSHFDSSLTLYWSDTTNGTGFFTGSDVMSHVTNGFSPSQLRAVKRAATAEQIPSLCPQNFNLFSECYAAVVFNTIPSSKNSSLSTIGYTLRADGGLYHIDVVRHTSDFETRILPLQWAVDRAIIEITTGVNTPTPLEWPYTIETNSEQFRHIRLSYIRGLRTLLVLALFINFVGITYQLPGAFSGERANALTSHLKVMGLLDSARIISWHLSISLAYLPAWIIVALTWHYRIFTETSVALILLVHLLLGLSLASWSFFIATPFGKSPQLAAVTTTLLAILFAILALVFSHAGTGAAFIFTIILPPGFYIFAIRAICGFENHLMPTNAIRGDPDNQLTLLPLLLSAIINIFLWPYLSLLLERRIFDAREPRHPRKRFWSRTKAEPSDESFQMPPDTAIAIRNLGKTFSTSTFGRKSGVVTAVSDLSLTIPKSGIFVLLGSNGAGKSTTLSILAGLIGRSYGTVTFQGNVSSPPRGTMGIVPQKNVLFPELTCYQTLRLWDAVKRPLSRSSDDFEQLLRDCDLGRKIHANASTLSGGQKRKLQLAIGLVGGSSILLVDECTSGVDPLSRRALWRTLSAVRHDRTVVFTTHFLDEADLLADHIAVLAAPGKLVASGSPVSLKSTLGEGYSVQVTLTPDHQHNTTNTASLLQKIRNIAPDTHMSSESPNRPIFHLKAKDPVVVERVLQLLEDSRAHFSIDGYDVLGTSIEDIFLKLMDSEEPTELPQTLEKSASIITDISVKEDPTAVVKLGTGNARSPFSQAFTIFHKRVLITRRSWLTPLLAVMVAVAGSCIPLFFMAGRAQSCATSFRNSSIIPLYLPNSPLALFSFGDSARVLEAPPNIIGTSLGGKASLLKVANVTDNATFVDTVRSHYRNLTWGGISIDQQSGQSLFAWEATAPGFKGPMILNLATNVLYNQALNSSTGVGNTPRLLTAFYESFPPVDTGVLVALKFLAFFGATMSVFPAFFSLYVSRERRSSVQAMQLSNGLSDPIGLWLGHLMFDAIFSVIAASIIIIIWATASNQFHGLGVFWIILVLYGITGTLFAYCVSLITKSPLAAFAATAGYQVIMFLLYIAGYLLTLTYAKTSSASRIITIIHFTLSLLSPVASVLRASFVSVNQFGLLCNGIAPIDLKSIAILTRYGGPIVYLIIYSCFLLAVLVWVDSGTILSRSTSARKKSGRGHVPSNSSSIREDVRNEAAAVSKLDSEDSLKVLQVTKTYGSTHVVENVSFGVAKDTVFALLGPNGAGKTTTFKIIGGDVIPDNGDVLIQGVSVVHHPRRARLSLGVCPQFTAIDSQLTVREHLMIYGRLKGLNRGPELRENVENLMQATSLSTFADRLASKLSGGNQRKLSLAIALIGNPSVILIDEFSTGIDARMKRAMWGTLRKVARGKAVIITTHSMEEASALANKVGIMAQQLLAIGTSESLSARHATYEVHFSCRTREELARAQRLMSTIPSARQADDVATRFEVSLESTSLVQLFHQLANQGDFMEYTVERAGLESVFLKVIRQNEVEEESGDDRTRRESRQA